MNQIADIIAKQPRLVSVNDPEPLPLTMRKKIAEVVSKIDWPSLGNQKPWETNKTLKALADEIDAGLTKREKRTKLGYEYEVIYRASVSLVLTAWDKQLGRTQYSDTGYYLRCCDDKARLLVGKTYQVEHLPSSSTISWDWPWANKGWTLRPVLIQEIFFNSPDSTYDDLKAWNQIFSSLGTILRGEEKRNPHN